MIKNNLFFLLIVFSLPCFGQEVSTDSTVIDSIPKESIFDFVSKVEVLEMKIETDFDSLFTYKNKIVRNLSGKVSFTREQEEETILKIGIRPRGKYRRRICDIPPLRVKFKKKGLKNLGLSSNFNSLKLVTHCLKDKKEAKSNVLKEYLTYQIYNLHSEHSLRTQLVKVTYVQAGSSKKLFTGYGILIENEDELAHRVNATIVKKMGIPNDSLAVSSSNMNAMFQCMIGNSDWSIYNLRNVKILRIRDQEKLRVFPYDFDFSGFVNTAYAIPNPDYNLKSTKDRVFLGAIYSEEEMLKTANHFLDRKDASIKLCKSFKKLSKWRRKELIQYLKSFYKILEKEKTLYKKLIELSPKK